jgi:hypothetical protein
LFQVTWEITLLRQAYISDVLLPCGPGSVIGIAIGYGLDGPRIESRWGRIIPTCPDRPWSPPSLLYNGYRVFRGVKSGRGVTLTPHPLLVSWSYTSTPPVGRRACTKPQCLYKGALCLPSWRRKRCSTHKRQ